MQIASFHHAATVRAGVLTTTADGPAVVDLAEADPTLPGEVTALLDADRDLRDRVERVVAAAPARATRRLAELRLAPAIPRPGKVILIGLNYRDHAEETGMELPVVPTVFSKFPESLIGAGAPIVLPPESEQVDFEAELAFVIGRAGRRIPAERALEHVGGYSVFNDVSARDVQLRTTQWTLGKTFDSFGPLGPTVVTRDEVEDPHALPIRLSVDGEVLQDSSTSQMVFGIPELVAFLSAAMTLRPGDVVATGTPAGVGFTREPPRFLTPGARVRVEIDGVGVLENPVVAEEGR